jgi:hypothetical protein
VRDDDPELARTMAASVQQHIAFGERAGQQVRRIGSGFGYEGDSSTLTGIRCARVYGFSLHANTLVPAPSGPVGTAAALYGQGGGYPSSARSAMRTVTSSTPSHAPGRMAPRGSNSRPWNSWRSSQRWYRYRACI